MSEMAPSSEHTIRPVSEWLVQTLRLTAFPDPQAEIAYRLWWNEVFGEPPDTVAEEPRKGRYRAEGPFQSGKAILQVQLGRIDWLLTIGEPEADELPSIGNYEQNLEAFTAFVSRWFAVESCPVLRRLAFGAVLLYPVADREEGYRHLQPYLHDVRLDPVHSADFQYRINRPRDSTSEIAELHINRLTTWSVMNIQAASVQMGPDGVSQTIGPQNFACRLELDINTAPSPTLTLAPNSLTQIFGVLVTLGDQIIREGDIS